MVPAYQSAAAVPIRSDCGETAVAHRGDITALIVECGNLVWEWGWDERMMTEFTMIRNTQLWEAVFVKTLVGVLTNTPVTPAE